MVRHYLAICQKNGLLSTGGSDYHGAANRKHNLLGACTVDYQVVGRLKELAGKGNGGTPKAER
jgi:hypothetical protein